MDFEVQMILLSTFTIVFILGFLGWAYFKLRSLSANAPKSDTFEDSK